MEQEQKYYVYHRDIALTKFDTEDGAMISIMASPDKEKWLAFSWDEAQEARSFTGWKIKKSHEEEENYY
jgi:hypothetical protein